MRLFTCFTPYWGPGHRPIRSKIGLLWWTIIPGLAGLMPAVAVEVLFLGGGGTATSGADAAAMSYLQERYGAANVTYQASSVTNAGDESGYDVLVISSTVSSSTVRGKYHTSAVPVLCWERVVVDNDESGDFGITSAFVESETDHQIRITGAHPITAGFAVDQVVQICSGSIDVFWSVTPQASGAVNLAEDDDTASQRFITVVEQGDILMGGGASPGRRVAFGLRNNTFDDLTADGRQLFGQAVDWAAQGAVDPDPPVVTNTSAGVVGASSATIGGMVTDNGGVDPAVVLYWGDDDGGTDPQGWDASIAFGPQGGAFSTMISGLAPSTTYYFRSFASNGGGDDWADTTASFTTTPLPDPPSVENLPATEITFTEADLNGEVTGTGGEAPQVVVFYGTSDGGTDPGNWEEAATLDAQTGAFSTSVFALSAGTTYYFRTFAQNAGGSAWAPSGGSFATQAYQLPVVETEDAAAVTGTAAQLGGTVTSTGGDAPIVTLYWGNEDGGTDVNSWDSSQDVGRISEDFARAVTGLSPLTVYYFRARAENAAGVSWSGQTRSFTTLDVSVLIVSEFMAGNDGGTANNPNGWWPIDNQVPGTTDDWIEIQNSGATTLDLGGWHLTDEVDPLDNWTFPPNTLVPAGGFLIVYASGDDAPDAMGNLHTNFKLGVGGEFVALVRPNLTIASSYGRGGADYPAQSDDISYGAHPVSAEPVFFTSPTPGAANDANGLARVADTKFMPDRGYYAGPVDVDITTETLGAEIYYTIDGSTPLDESGNPSSTATLYDGPVTVSQTTVLRAAATLAGLAPTNIDTHSYFLFDIAGAAADGSDPAALNTPFLMQTQPAGWGDLASGDYEMDTTVSMSTTVSTGHAGASVSQAMLSGVRDLPTISIAMERNDFVGPNGIYTNPQQRNDSSSGTFAWERACSAEFIPAEGDLRSDWGENCGIRVQGGASRNPGSSPKHSMSLRFRAEYGTGRLDEDLFPDSPVDSFNVLSLRAGYNNSWIHRDGGQRSRGSMIRDQWARDTMLEMGNEDGGQGMMVHLFVNGLYWGVHNLCERQDASHYASYNGTDEETTDALNGGAPIDGDTVAWNAMKSVVAGGNWTEIQDVLDVDNYIDYQVLNRFGANADLKTNGNWRAAGGGPFPAGQPGEMAPWKLYSWDGERILEAPGATNTPLDPAGIRGSLDGLAEYRMRFADRLQKHFFNGGALEPDVCGARWMARAAELDRAIIGESARWGDHRRNPAYTRDAEWLSEQARLMNSYFPVRSSNVLSRYQTDGFFPSIDAPVFVVDGVPQHGGEIPSGGSLTLTAGSGTIYYTLDGSDPRLEGGELNPAAVAISSGGEVTLPSSLLVRTRLLEGGEWSALEESEFYVEPLAGAGDLVMSEVHYHPYGATEAEKAAGLALTVPRDLSDPELFEFVEIRNNSAGAVNLAGVRFGSGIVYTFEALALEGGGHVVLARDEDAFKVRYPGVPRTGIYGGNLENSGEELTLLLANGDVAASLSYNASGRWPDRADGGGSSLELIDASGDSADSENWRSSSEFNGSPSVAGAGPDMRIVINEVLSHSVLPDLDAIELHNTTAASVDVSGWVLSDLATVYRSFRIPDGTMILPDGYLWFDEDDFNPIDANQIDGYAGTPAAAPTEVDSPGHELATGDVVTISGYGGFGSYEGSFEVTVIDGDTFSIDTPYLDNDATAGSWAPGRPFALSSARGETLWLLEASADDRLLGFADQVDFAAGFPNVALGRWPDGAGTGTLVTMELNTLGGANAGPVVGPIVISEVMYHPAGSAGDQLEYVEILNTGELTENLEFWRLRGGADFDFGSADELLPAGSLVIVPFDPVLDVSAATAFRTEYGIDEGVLLVGPFWDGPLDDESGVVRLQQPDHPPVDEPDFHPQVTVDEVIYSSSAPWPPEAAGGGDSLQRIELAGFGNFVSSWAAAVPNPGSWGVDYDGWSTLFFGPGSPSGSGRGDDPDLDSAENLLEFALGMNPLVSDPERLPVGQVIGSEFVFTYARSIVSTGLTFTVQVSTDMLEWAPVTDEAIGISGALETREARIPMTDSRLFVRLLVTE